MKTHLLSMIGAVALSATTLVVQAQDYDDIYYDGASTKSGVTKSENAEPATTATGAYARRQPTAYKVKVAKNYQADRDVDEYNRRGVSEYDPMDTTFTDVDEELAFANTQRIERFYNPDVVVASGDNELIEIYYDEAPTVNLVLGSSTGFIGYDNYYYDPWFGWYDPLYSPWVYSYYRHRPYSPWYGWYSWYSPYWYSGWAWGWDYPHRYAWGWGGPHFHHGHGGWDGHHWADGRRIGGGLHDRGSRRPGDSRSLLAGPASRANSRSAHSMSSTRSSRQGYSGITRSGAAASSTRAGSMSSGRTRTSATGTGVTARSRTSSMSRTGVSGSASTTHSGSYSSGTRSAGRSSGSGYSGARSSSRSSGSSYSGSSSRSSSSYSGSSSRSSSSYGSSSRSSSYGSSSRSSGSSYSGSRGSSSGGHSGGGRSGGGGGGRRH